MTNARYAMKYQTSSALATTKAKSLGYGGPLVVAQDHLIKLMLPDVVDAITDGNAEWLLSQYLMHELLVEGFGEPLNPKYFISYLTDKYSALYQLEK